MLWPQHALIGAYRPEGEEWLSQLLAVLSSNAAWAYDYICAHFQGVTLARPQGTYMRTIPKMQVYNPCDAAEMKAVVDYVAGSGVPCYIRGTRSRVEDVYPEGNVPDVTKVHDSRRGRRPGRPCSGRREKRTVWRETGRRRRPPCGAIPDGSRRRDHVLGMDALGPVIRVLGQLPRSVAEDFRIARGIIDRVGPQVPIPDAVVGPPGDQGVAFLALAQGLLGLPAFGDIVADAEDLDHSPGRVVQGPDGPGDPDRLARMAEALPGQGQAGSRGGGEIAQQVFQRLGPSLRLRLDKIRQRPARQIPRGGTEDLLGVFVAKRDDAMNAEITEILGDAAKVTAVRVTDKADGSEREIPTDAVFVAIGLRPNTEIATQLGLTLDARGFIQIDRGNRTSIPRIYAAGDVTGGSQQIVNAVGEGSTAALSAFEDLTHPYWKK